MTRHHDEPTGPPESKACEECPAAMATRRVFLRNAAMAVVGALSLSAAASTASALLDSMSEAEPLDIAGDLRSYAIPATDGIVVDAANDVMLARWQNRGYAFSLKCPHRGTRLEWLANENRVFCPKHKARFQPDGLHDSGRRSRDLDRYEISRKGNTLIVDLAAIRRSDSDSAAWTTAVVALT